MQRALFARVLVQDADLILLDEPFNAIDSQTVAVLLGLIRHWHAEGRTIMTVLHDLDLAQSHFPEILRLAGIAEVEPAAADRGRQALRLAAGRPA